MTRAASRLLLLLCLLPPADTLAQLGGEPIGNDPFARVQFIHNVTDIDTLDIYLDNKLWLDDFEYRSATPFAPIPNGTHKFDFVNGADPDNSTPLWSNLQTVLNSNRYILVAQGHASDMQFVFRQDIRETSFSGDPEFFIIHGSPDAGPMDVRLMDPTKDNIIVRLIQNNLIFGQSGIYHHLPPAPYNFEVTTADNKRLLGIYYLDLSFFADQTFVILTSGTDMSSTEGVAMIAYDENGGRFSPPLVTDSYEAEVLPASFRLEQNYPNPFNPVTHITYVLPYPSLVRLNIYDMLGRRVRTLVNADQRMGTYTVTWDGSSNAGRPVPSSTYLYRIEADDRIQTRAMLLLK